MKSRVLARKNYSSAMIRYALLLRYTSLQSYKPLSEKFPLPSIPLLNETHSGGADTLKTVKLLHE